MNYQGYYNNSEQPITIHNVALALTRRGPWSPEEDRKLMELISIFGPSNWVRIASNLGTRTPKQCRERYHQNLKPSLNRSPISVEEGELIEKFVAKYGKKWAEISRHLNGRSDNAIKNWWNGGANRRRKASLANNEYVKEGYPNQSSSSNLAAESPENESGRDGKELIKNDSNKDSDTNLSGSLMKLPTQIHMRPEPVSSTKGQFALDSSLYSVLPLPNQSHTILKTNLLLLAQQQVPATQASAHFNSRRGLPFTGSGNIQPLPSVPQVHASSKHLPPPPHIPQISFNTSIFGSEAEKVQKSAVSSITSPVRAKSSRSSSFDVTAHGIPPPIANKRRLLEESLSERRHSTTNTMYHQLNSSNFFTRSHPNLSSTLSSSSTASPYFGSPLSMSRNNSICHSDIHHNSSGSSRRSSIAPDFFPNPLKEASHKRTISQNSFNSTFLGSSNRFSVSSGSGNNNLSNILTANTSPMTISRNFTGGGVSNGSVAGSTGVTGLTNNSSAATLVKDTDSTQRQTLNAKSLGDRSKGSDISDKKDAKISVSSLID